MNDREREPDGYYVEKVYGWRLAVAWVLLFAAGWAAIGLVAWALCRLFVLAWGLLP